MKRAEVFMFQDSTAGEFSRGFTLVELMVSMAVFSVLMAAVYGIYISYSRTAVIQNASAWAQQSVRAGIELMARDLRMAGFDPTGEAGAGIEELRDNKIRFTIDRDGNGRIENSSMERITYLVSGRELRKILYEGDDRIASSAVINNVSALEFRRSGRRIFILLSVEEPAGMAGTVKRSLGTEVFLRNLDS